MEKPLVSIIMGAYNCEMYLDNCISSILSQTYDNWEFIICDDCSTDNTLVKLQKYSSEDSRIIVLHNNVNKRLAASLNECLKVAHGKYIARMDADDESYPNRLRIQVEFLEKHPELDVVGTSVRIFDESGEKGIRCYPKIPQIRNLIFNPPFAHPTILMKKQVYDKLGGYTVSQLTMRAEDLELWYRFFKNGYKGVNLKEPLYKYHESIEDYKKRTVKAAWNTCKVFIDGYKKLNVPFYIYPFALKPLISSLIPKKINYLYHNRNKE